MKIVLLAFFSMIMISEMTFAQTAPPLETGVSQELARWRSANYSNIRYKLNITLEKGAPLMKGTIEVGVKLTDEAAKNDLVLDWRTTQFGGDKDKPFAEVEKVNEQIVKETVQNGVFDYQTNKEHLIVSKKYLKTGENVLRIKFASPIKTSGAGVTRYIDKEDGAEYVYSLFVPSDASTAFPVFDQPDIKARFSLIVNAPVEWKVTSNEPFYFLNTNYNYVPESIEEVRKGNIRRREESKIRGDKNLPSERIFELSQNIPPAGRKLYYFYETKPISTYVFAFAVGEFVQFDEQGVFFNGEDFLPLNKETTPHGIQSTGDGKYIRSNSLIYVRKSQAEKFKAHAKEVFRLNREGVKFLEDYFDYKFPFPKYDLVLIPEFPFGGMEHAGATFLRESSVIFPTEPTKNDYVSRANVIFHEAAHQWFGDTVTMKWFDDLWLKEGFAEFMAYKTLEKVMPEYNAWKIFYERNKQAAYLTDSTKGTTPIYQEIPNLSAAKSAYGNIVYRKAPSFLKQAEFYLGEKEFQTAVRAFLKNHQYANAEWTDLVKEFETASKQDLKDWANSWVTKRGVPVFRFGGLTGGIEAHTLMQSNILGEENLWKSKLRILLVNSNGSKSFDIKTIDDTKPKKFPQLDLGTPLYSSPPTHPIFVFPNYQDYGYGIFLLDEKSRAYVLANIQTEKDDFLRAMMWGSLWDSVREAELAPADYVELVIKNINVETDESTIQTLLGRVSTAMNYYIPDDKTQSVPPALAGGSTRQIKTSNTRSNAAKSKLELSADADGADKAALAAKVEKLLIEKFQTAATVGQKITYFRALQSIGSGEQTRQIFKDLLNGKSNLKDVSLKTKDKFDLVTRLLILGDKDAPAILARLEKTETSDEAKRYAYAAKAGIATAENKQKFWNDLVSNKEISESWIEAAFVPFNSIRHSELTLPFLEKALAELPTLKKNRKIFFVNGWLGAFIGGQKSEQALKIVNDFLDRNPNLDRDLRLKILENADNLERAVKIRAKYGK